MKIRSIKNHLLLVSAFLLTVGCNIQNVPISEIPAVNLPGEIPVIIPPSTGSSGTNLYKNLVCDLVVGGARALTINNAVVGSKKVICIKAGVYDVITVEGLTGLGSPIVIQNLSWRSKKCCPLWGGD